MMYWTTTAVAMTAVVMMIAAAALIKKRNPVPVVAAVITNSIFIDYLGKNTNIWYIQILVFFFIFTYILLIINSNC